MNDTTAKIWFTCRCSTSNEKLLCPGYDHCHHFCARMITKQWGNTPAEAEQVIERSNAIGLPAYTGPLTQVPGR